MMAKTSTCTFCDGGCTLTAEEVDGNLCISPANPSFPAICSKAYLIDEYRLHPDRLTSPLRRVGSKGSGKFEKITWDKALDEIADRLQTIINESGPEAIAASEMPLNHGFGGLTRRLMNSIGSPNYITALELCMGNTFQVHRAVYGGPTVSDWTETDCIVYFGQNRGPELWPAEYLRLKEAKKRGATLIEIDPRTTDTARLADRHLAIRYGTDAALALGWINVIIEEGLYDAEFVAAQCTGFDALRQRVAEYTPNMVEEICGIPAADVRETAHIYANAKAAIIPWGATADMQVNSTSLIQAQCILRAICGFLDKSEKVLAPSQGFITNSEVCRFDLLKETQREKQLGAQEHPLLTSRASALYKSVLKRTNIKYEPDILATSHCAVPSSVFAAMRGEGPYRVRALLSIANNTLMSYAGQSGIQQALQELDLLVVFENWLTPTAQLSDFVLPGDMWAERDTLGKPFDVAAAATANQAFRPRVKECRSWFFVVKGLAKRLGCGDLFPWKDERDFFNWRVAPLGLTFDDVCARHTVFNNSFEFDGWLTPSGKIELVSSVLNDLGCDPLPSFIEPQDPGTRYSDIFKKYDTARVYDTSKKTNTVSSDNVSRDSNFPYLAFAGARECANYNTALRQMTSLRRRNPEPLLFINPTDARMENISEGQWTKVDSAYGSVCLLAHLDENQPVGTIRVPHGWWKPELASGLSTNLSAANTHNDGVLFPDAEWNLDSPQGVPGLRGSIHVRISPVDTDSDITIQ